MCGLYLCCLVSEVFKVKDYFPPKIYMHMFKLLFDLWQHVLVIKLTGRAKKICFLSQLILYIHTYMHTYINDTIYEENSSASLLSEFFPSLFHHLHIINNNSKSFEIEIYS